MTEAVGHSCSVEVYCDACSPADNLHSAFLCVQLVLFTLPGFGACPRARADDPKNAMASLADDEAETRHFNECNLACLQYEAHVMEEVNRRKRHLASLSQEFRDKLPVDTIEKQLGRLEKAASANQSFLRGVVQQQCPPHIYDRDYNSVTCAERHLTKVKVAIEQCVRDWAVEGKKERDEIYSPIIRELQQYVPLGEQGELKHKRKVLLPGVGLARLLLEVCLAGYAGQGNEFDYFMLFVSDCFLNGGLKANSIKLYPWIHDPNNVLNREDALKPIMVPDVSCLACAKANPGMDMSMTMGEFIQVYDTQENYGLWDSVVTCFFVDTAPNVLEYCKVIHKILKPGGVWINVGPLVYHWYHFGASPEQWRSDDRYLQSLELSYEELKYAIEMYGFTFLTEERVTTHYNRRPASMNMKETTYNAMFFTVQKGLASD